MMGDIIYHNNTSQVSLEGRVSRVATCGWLHTLLLAELLSWRVIFNTFSQPKTFCYRSGYSLICEEVDVMEELEQKVPYLEVDSYCTYLVRYNYTLYQLDENFRVNLSSSLTPSLGFKSPSSRLTYHAKFFFTTNVLHFITIYSVICYINLYYI